MSFPHTDLPSQQQSHHKSADIHASFHHRPTYHRQVGVDHELGTHHQLGTQHQESEYEVEKFVAEQFERSERRLFMFH